MTGNTTSEGAIQVGTGGGVGVNLGLWYIK